MGDNPLKLFALLLIFILPLFSLDTLKWVDDQVKAIDQNRSGVDQAKLDTIHTPFLLFHTNPPIASTSKTAYKKGSNKRYSVTFNLMAIINNSALINNKWIKLNELLYGYRLQTIKNDSVILKHEKYKRTVTLSKTNPKIRIEVY